MSRPIPKCHVCGCIEDSEGWVQPKKKIPKSQVYDTLCKNCLTRWTDNLIAEIEDEKAA